MRIPDALTKERYWSPNAGVLRLDPLGTIEESREQVKRIVAEVKDRRTPTYLPEQYYLAEKLSDWHHIDIRWNWEVWPEMDDPGYNTPANRAAHAARESGWGGAGDLSLTSSGSETTSRRLGP